MKVLRAVIVVAVLVSLLVLPSSPAGAQLTPPGVLGSHTVTLVTGDVVRLSRFQDGRQATAIEPNGPSGRHGYQVLTRNGDSFVIPNEVVPLVDAGRLDEALFNVTDLVADGYDDATRQSLPLLVTAPAGVGTLATPAGATRVRDLASINTVAMTEDKARAREFWASAPKNGKVWLDRKVRATLTDSVRQVGAPEAWANGLDGSGVTVAVLDTGYDPTHPDLAGRVTGSADFTGAGSAVDAHGHGTHVAATVGASAGRKGVAPGAALLIGRVLDGEGSGDLSWAIAGMEWAVAQGARVVNMSFGAGASDGTDPVSEAVNALTASSGTLFVSAAGNSGPGAGTVEAPGAATAALTVGAVSKKDKLAGFSSRGPRLGDGAVKPELTAPGVDIIAARAAGTALGELVDARYTSLSGTSMATPHVAGAAAILAQRHPEWRAAELKAALVGGARPVDTAAQANALGTGRLDIPAALRSPLLAGTSSVAFGHLEWTAAPKTADVSYRNISGEPVTVDLAASATAPGSSSAALSVAPRTLTIAPGATGKATIRLDPRNTKGGGYTGQLVASGKAGTVRIPVGFLLDGPTHTLTVSALDRLGRPAGTYSQAQLWNLDTGEFQRGIIGDEPATLRVPAGRYALVVYVFTVDEAGWERELSVHAEPQLTISGDRTLRYDARTANQVRVITPEDAELRAATVAWQRVVGANSLITGFNFNTNALRRYYAAPSAPATLGTFELTHHFQMAEPKLIASVVGRHSYRLPNPRHVYGSPALDGHRWLRIVDGRDGTPEQLAAARVRGAAALIRLTDYEKVPDQLRAAAEAGARTVFLRSDEPGFFEASADGAPIAAYHLEKADAQPILDRITAGEWISLVLAGSPESPYTYQLHLPERGRISDRVTYDSRLLRLATVESRFNDTGDGGVATDTFYALSPTALAAYSTSREFSKPSRRKDYLTTGGPGGEVLWRHEAVANHTAFFARAIMNGVPRVYRSGERTREDWFPAIVRPGMPPVAWPATASDLAYGTPVNRANDVIRVAMPHYASGDFEQYGWLDFSSDRGRLALYREGALLAETTRPFDQFTVPRGAATYKLTLDVARDRGDAPSWWTTSTATSTAWTFRSERTEVLPLLQVEYDLDTATRLVLRPGYQPGATARGPIDLRAEISFDDAKTWHRLDGHRSTDGSVTVAPPRPPHGAEFATLRVSAWDRAGNRIDQTIHRAWRLN